MCGHVRWSCVVLKPPSGQHVLGPEWHIQVNVVVTKVSCVSILFLLPSGNRFALLPSQYMCSCSVLIDFENPEKCQEACQADPACAGFTLVLFSNWCRNILVYILSSYSWTNENSDVVSLACVLFSNLGEETSCQNCISGRQSCLVQCNDVCLPKGWLAIA